MIIDAHPLVRAGIRRALGERFAAHELPDGRQAPDLIASVGRIDVAIVEFRAEEAAGPPAGAAVVRELVRSQPSIGVVARSGCLERYELRLARDSGAHGFIGKAASGQVLGAAVAAALGHREYLDPELAAGKRQAALTRRQRQVLQLFADGHATADIARRLGLSEETIRTHSKACLTRLGARGRTHAIAIAMRTSMID